MDEKTAEKIFDTLDDVEASIMDVFYARHYDVPLSYAMIACQRLAARMSSDIGVTPLNHVKSTRQIRALVEQEKKEPDASPSLV